MYVSFSSSLSGDCSAPEPSLCAASCVGLGVGIDLSPVVLGGPHTPRSGVFCSHLMLELGLAVLVPPRGMMMSLLEIASTF